jgi:hypothetical protein
MIMYYSVELLYYVQYFENLSVDIRYMQSKLLHIWLSHSIYSAKAETLKRCLVYITQICHTFVKVYMSCISTL